ncbi:DNA internalization-related competence protein ComEC/Rec2 [Pseudoxanthomonas jiangsuensis]|uniref:DNA internalization-related competence protein ComEC/Rec2 n=1 Tax=Pseudoxanthomonas jiangsuensis TaxID=619688 RepID=UPI001391A1F1|nr:DNA internalization-related competence protein ComEC/Rec2 [Pseudoxanthomonas jiangsuensis]KAF1693344.1 DNA internalization-related competence protein ComEC/Rec2 [Pseudoxanthomonas jiangsuensis]
MPAAGLACAAAVLGGALACLFLPTLAWAPLRWACCLLGALAWLWPGRLRLVGALLFGFGWAGLHAGWALAAQLPQAREAREAQVSGQVVGLPDHEARRTRFQFRVDARAPPPLRGRLLQLSWYDDYDADRPGPRMALKPGAHWSFQLRLRAPRGLSNPGGGDFGRYALAQRIAAPGYVRAPQLARELVPAAGIDAWRGRAAARIEAAGPSASSRFVRALALGDTRGLDDADWNVLRAVGLTHLIAISGFHVGLVAGFAAWLAVALWWLAPALGRCWPRPQAAAVAAVLGAAGYAAVAGFALPTVRTLLMITVVAVARLARRATGLWQALALALLAVLLADPLAVLQAGFWLSFAGVAWLLWCLPEQGGAGQWLRGFLSAQGVATVGLLPLAAVLFNQASLAGPLANLLAIPWWSLVVVPLSLLGTGLEVLHAGAGGWAWRAAAACFEPSWRLFAGMAESPFALWWLPEPRSHALPLALLGAFWLLLPRGLPGRPLALLLWLPLLWPPRELPGPGGVELQVLDVGQGLAVVVRTARHALLYDAGPAVRDGYDAGERAVLPALRALGVARLDRVGVSHADQDHAGGWPAVQAVVPVALSLAPAGAPLAVDAPCLAGEGWSWDGVDFRFLHPPPHFPYLRNEASCVLRIASRHGAVLLPGDAGEVIEQRLLREARQLRADVVVVPHHGSGGSSSAGFVAATGARLALVAAGYGNRFGHPRAEVVERWRRHGAEVLETPRSGAIRVWLDEDGIAVRERRAWKARLWDPVEQEDSSL